MRASFSRQDLADDYPLTRLTVGALAFHALADRFRQEGDPMRRDDPSFPLFLRRSGAPMDAVQTAEFEKLKREAECAPQATPLYWSDFNLMAEPIFMALPIRRLPSARIWTVDGPAPPTVAAFYPGLAQARFVLLAQRSGGVLVLPVEREEAMLIAHLGQAIRIESVLERLSGLPDCPNPLRALCLAIGHDVIVGAVLPH